MNQFYNTLFFLALFSIAGCEADPNKASGIDDALSSQIKDVIEGQSTVKFLNDSLKNHELLKAFYKANEEKPVWSESKKLLPITDTFVQFIAQSQNFGLFKEDYQFATIKRNYDLLRFDSTGKTKTQDWLLQEIMLSDAYLSIIRDLKFGRINDSLKKQLSTEKYVTTFEAQLDFTEENSSISHHLRAVQPMHTDYWNLVNSASGFTDSMDIKRYTPLGFPYNDSIAFVKQFKKRMAESGFAIDRKERDDSTALVNLILKYQGARQLKKDGKISASLVKQLNNTDYNKFLKFALTLDKYRSLPARMPGKYIWVNIPSFYLKVMNADTVALVSKVICGKPTSSTPEIRSEISDLVMYPTWTVPNSIITKEMIPGLRRNTNYLARRGLYLLDGKGRKVNPARVNWSKYSKGIPYRVQQGSGDGNSLGVMKFNFKNDHSVYLHDTNQRYLFKNSYRSLSHGCVRVELWRELAHYIANNDSMMSKTPTKLKYTADSIDNWLVAKKMRKIDVNYKIPLYIVYFSAYAEAGRLKFYDDVYSEDSRLIAKYYGKRNLSL